MTKITINLPNGTELALESLNGTDFSIDYPKFYNSMLNSLSLEADNPVSEDNSIDLFNCDKLSQFSLTKTLAVHSLNNALQNFSEKLITSKPGMFEKLVCTIKIKDGYVIVENINYRSLFNKIEKLYNENNLSKIFIINYNKNDLIRYNKKKIKTKNQMRIDNIQFKLFFSIEIVSLFLELGKRFSYKPYYKLANLISEKTYVKNIRTISPFKTPISEETKKSITVDLLPHQMEFIELYPYIKKVLSLRGIILSFDQGLGKTLTSLVLAQNLAKEQIIIICPNTLKAVWADEIYSKFNEYRENFNLARKRIYVESDQTKRFTAYDAKETKYIIVNNEAIGKIIPLVKIGIKTMIIIDECHNFRYLDGQRLTMLLSLITKLEKSAELDVLPMSGTPIKAKPSEIVPALMCIDSLFDMECARIYAACFNIDSTEAAKIINKRFSFIIYRKLKSQELTLPEKHIEKVYYTITDPYPYLSSTVREDVVTLFKEIYAEMYKDIEMYADRYEKLVWKYSSAPEELTKEYLRYVRKTNIEGKEIYVHELTLDEFLKFGNIYIKPNIKDKGILKEFIEIETKYVKISESAMGKAVGAVVPKRRAQMFIDIINENTEAILKYIYDAPKKVCIFSSSIKVVARLDEVLTEHEIGHVTITGENAKERPALIKRFKEDDSIDVILGSNKTLEVGVTLTEANIMLIFGTPWRQSDMSQITDRIHRIGQTDECFIYTVYLETKEKNLSNRMEEILKWSGEMTDSYIDSIVTNTEEKSD
jgi:SNF2 family DNA or RNA helicase